MLVHAPITCKLAIRRRLYHLIKDQLRRRQVRVHVTKCSYNLDLRYLYPSSFRSFKDNVQIRYRILYLREYQVMPILRRSATWHHDRCALARIAAYSNRRRQVRAQGQRVGFRRPPMEERNFRDVFRFRLTNVSLYNCRRTTVNGCRYQA